MTIGNATFSLLLCTLSIIHFRKEKSKVMSFLRILTLFNVSKFKSIIAISSARNHVFDHLILLHAMSIIIFDFEKMATN